MIIDDLKSQISKFLQAGQWDEFFDWFAPLPLEIESCGDPVAIHFVHSIHADLVDFDEGFLDEPNLRENLAAKLKGSSGSYFVMATGSMEVITTGTALATPSPAGFVWLLADAERASAP